RDPRVKAEHEAQEQKPIRTGDTSNGEGSSNMISKVALMDQDIGSTDGETLDRDTYNFTFLSQPENL
ncbi:7611_t:CDS:2, partial [Dentiscutata heterogama]